MVGIHMFRFFYLFFIIFCNFLYHVTSYRDTSAVDPNYYDIHSLAEEEICHPLRIKLKPIPIHNAIIIRPNNVFDRWLFRTSDLFCKFKIKIGRRERFMAVIQNLSFRQIDGECLDYIKFRRKNQNETKKFCGQFNRKKKGIDNFSADMNYIDETLHVYEKSDAEGEIETTIFVSKKPLEPNDPPLDITIIYTPYKDCTSEYHERIGDLNRSSRQWNYCIAEQYICDGYQNCSPEICNDEINCLCDIQNNGTGAKVTVAAVTTIVLCFIIFLMSLWICRRHKKLCWSPDCAGPVQEDNRFSHVNRESGAVSDQPVSTAPMLQVSVVPTALDKDLPPSYDSLFPEHANPSTT